MSAPTMAQIVAGATQANLARYLRDASPAELAQLCGALAAEMLARGIRGAEPLGCLQARLEARAEAER